MNSGTLVVLKPITRLASIHMIRKTYDDGKIFTYCGIMKKKEGLVEILSNKISCRACMRARGYNVVE